MDIKQIQFDYMENRIFTIDDLKIYRGNRIGVVAPNGSGKTTLLKMLNRDIYPGKGTIQTYGTIALMEQQASPNFSPLIDEKQRKILNIPTNYPELSGGEATKLKFLEVYSKFPDVLLLDEPTAHMDIQGRQFVIDQLKHYYGAFILVSHDRYLLNRLVEEIWEIQNQKIIKYTGNYTEYKTLKDLEFKQAKENYFNVQEEKLRLNKALSEKKRLAATVTNKKNKKEFRSKPGRMTKSKDTAAKSLHKAAKSLEKRIKRMDDVFLPKEKQSINFDSKKIKEIHTKYPIMIDYLDIKCGDKLLIKNVSLQVKLNKCVSITGKNGSGKSTLLKTIFSNFEGVNISKKAKIGYFNQNTHHQFQDDNRLTILEYCKLKSDYDEHYLIEILDRVNFKGNDLKKKLSQLSGGEATRLALLLIFVQDYNILLLDEPTNFLDIETIEVVEDFILKYPGTVVCISHDFHFIEKISDVIYYIEGKKLIRK